MKSARTSTNNKKHRSRVQDAQSYKKKRVTNINFDPVARNQYLTGFSERKRQRRVFGLAMQKVKDRKARLENRAEIKLALEEQIVEAERQKASVVDAGLETNIGLIEDNDGMLMENEKKRRRHAAHLDPNAGETQVQMYEDTYTRNQWGGEVIVTTTTDFPSDDESEVQNSLKLNVAKSTSTDRAQEYSGKVERYINELKGKLPSSKKGVRRPNQPPMSKGKHGALNMTGIGGDGNLKIAKKMLARTQGKATDHPKKKFKRSHKR